MKDPRKIRQTMQAAAAYLVGCSAALLATPFDWRALVAAFIAVTVALLTNPRLVGLLDNAMPEAGSSAVLPVQTLVQNPAAPAYPANATEDITKTLPKPRLATPIKSPDDPTTT
jgi:hypothetical protein